MSKMPAQDVGHRIRALREYNQYTRDAFAEKLDISSKFLYEIETGKKGFSVDILYRISKVLSVSTDYLIFGAQNDKISAKMREVLERFDAKQMTNLQKALEAMLGMCGK